MSELPPVPERAHFTFASRSVPAIAWICSLASLGEVLIYGTLALHVRWHLGRWPVPMFERWAEPYSIQLHESALLVWGYFALFAAGPVWLACLYWRVRYGGVRRGHWGQLALFLAGWAVIALIVNFDPTPFTDWLFD